jgi:hypothetical protein
MPTANDFLSRCAAVFCYESDYCNKPNSGAFSYPGIHTNTAIMSEEFGGITELQMLEAEVALLQTKRDAVKKAEKSSVACTRIIASVHAKEGHDCFLTTEGRAPNPFHSSAGSGGDGSCCVVL